VAQAQGNRHPVFIEADDLSTTHHQNWHNDLTGQREEILPPFGFLRNVPILELDRVQ
jgi:hypothetical protein